MNSWIYLLVAIASVVAAYGSYYVLNRQQLLDIPNERSSHTVPVPRGGGIAFTLLYLVVLVWLAVNNEIAIVDGVVLIVGGLVLAIVGFVDDRFGLSSKLRLLVQCVCSIGAITSLYYDVVTTANALIWIALALMVLVSVWWINLFNFLDGIDGYAASEAVFICISAAGLCFLAGAVTPAQLFLMLAISMMGFSIINWPPARLFMGDVGSYFLGFITVMLAMMTIREQLVSPLSWLILTALFWIDASYTLVSRVLKGERWYQAHRSHAYQILARRCHSHRRITVGAILINVGWLLPLTYGCQWLQDNQLTGVAFLVVILACAPIVWGVYKVKS